MQLTRRQETFLLNMLNLWRDYRHEPIHYTELAERVGVNRFTAYDMCRLLEEKGFVESTYRLTAGKSGPGRSEVVFRPTSKAHQLMSQFTDTSDEWESVKAAMLQRVRDDQMLEPETLTALIARVPDVGDSAEITYCAEILTILLLRATHPNLPSMVKQIMPTPDEVTNQQLNLLAGLTLGLLASQHKGNCTALIECVQQYQTVVASFSAEQCQRLAHFAHDLQQQQVIYDD